MKDNCAEFQRLTSNLNAVRQIRFRYESKVFQYNMNAEYFTVLLQEISTKRVQFLSFVMEMPDNWADDFNDDVKQLYFELKKSYKETADFFSELHKMATDKLNEAKIIRSQIAERKKTYNPEDLNYIKKILPKINEYITIDSTLGDWENLLQQNIPNKIMQIRCSNKLLADFISNLKLKRQLDIADGNFSNYFRSKKPISQRFISVATVRPPTEKDKVILKEIFATVQ